MLSAGVSGAFGELQCPARPMTTAPRAALLVLKRPLRGRRARPTQCVRHGAWRSRPVNTTDGRGIKKRPCARRERMPVRGSLWLLPSGPDQIRNISSSEPLERAWRSSYSTRSRAASRGAIVSRRSALRTLLAIPAARSAKQTAHALPNRNFSAAASQRRQASRLARRHVIKRVAPPHARPNPKSGGQQPPKNTDLKTNSRECPIESRFAE